MGGWGVGSELGFFFAVVVGVGSSDVILVSGLYFAAITFFSEGEVEVIAEEADPVSGFGMGEGVGGFMGVMFDGGEIIVHLNEILN